jgi:uncharacterized protein YmfQ (DUF2313 family)
MAYSADHYREQLKALLPPGRAFPRERGGTLDDLLDAMAQELARIDLRSDELASDAVPKRTTELLPDWERVAGLPDNCAGVLQETVQGRRADLVGKLTSTGGQSSAYFTALAADLGYEVMIAEFRPFRAGLSSAGDPLTNGDWVYTWRVYAPEVTVTYFKAGQSVAGEPLAAWGNDSLECRLRQFNPAHTIVQFAYGAFEALAAENGDILSTQHDFVILVEPD